MDAKVCNGGSGPVAFSSCTSQSQTTVISNQISECLVFEFTSRLLLYVYICMQIFIFWLDIRITRVLA